MIVVPRSRKGLGIVLIISAVICLISGIVDTVKYCGEIDDYHSLTAETIKSGKLVDGTIDEWYGPFAYTDDGSEIYFLELDNGQLISFQTYDEMQKSAFADYDGVTITTVEMSFSGKVKNMPEEDKNLMLEILVDEGFTEEEAEDVLIPYYLINYDKGAMKTFYITALVTGLLGFVLFLPEFNAWLKHGGVREKEFEANRYTSNTNVGYQSTYPATQKTYGNTQGMNNYTNYNNQQYNQQNIQNSQYTNNQYTAQEQNRQYVNNQYTAQEQNRQYVNNQYTSQGQNRQYVNNQYTAQGQNRQYVNDQYTAQGQNRTYANNQNDSDTQMQ